MEETTTFRITRRGRRYLNKLNHGEAYDILSYLNFCRGKVPVSDLVSGGRGSMGMVSALASKGYIKEV